MSRWIDLNCVRAFQVEIGNTWKGNVVFHERTNNADGSVKWRFKYTAPNPWVAPFDEGTFTPVSENGIRGLPVTVRVQTPVDDF